MRVRVRFFAGLRDATTDEMRLEMPPGARLSDLQAQLQQLWPALSWTGPAVLWAVDRRLTYADAPLSDGSEVAAMPPFSGG